MRIPRAPATTILLAAALGPAWAAFTTDPPNDADWPNAYYARGDNVGIGAANPLADYPDVFVAYNLGLAGGLPTIASRPLPPSARRSDLGARNHC